MPFPEALLAPERPLSLCPRPVIFLEVKTFAGFLSLLDLPLDQRELAQVLLVMLEALGFSAEISGVGGQNGLEPELGLTLLLTDDAEMECFNQRVFGLPGPTNVLSFPAPDLNIESGFANRDSFEDAPSSQPFQPCQLGELVLSLDTLRRESFLYGQDQAEHLLWLLAHGLGHLGGPAQLGAGGLEHGPEHDTLSEQAFSAGLAWLLKVRSTGHGN